VAAVLWLQRESMAAGISVSPEEKNGSRKEIIDLPLTKEAKALD